jgi:hypothetical protein
MYNISNPLERDLLLQLNISKPEQLQAIEKSEEYLNLKAALPEDAVLHASASGCSSGGGSSSMAGPRPSTAPPSAAASGSMLSARARRNSASGGGGGGVNSLRDLALPAVLDGGSSTTGQLLSQGRLLLRPKEQVTVPFKYKMPLGYVSRQLQQLHNDQAQEREIEETLTVEFVPVGQQHPTSVLEFVVSVCKALQGWYPRMSHICTGLRYFRLQCKHLHCVCIG